MSLIARLAARRPTARDDRGQVLVLFALFLVVLLGAAALAVDYGSWLAAKRGYQNASDAAALAGATHLTTPLTDPCGSKTKEQCAREAAWSTLKTQLGLSAANATTLGGSNTAAGAPYSENGYRIWVDSPPSAAGATYTGLYGTAGNIFVRVERNDQSYFGGIVGLHDTKVAAWATAGPSASAKYAVMALCPKGDARCPNSVQDVKIAGTNSGILLDGGDFGTNWGLTVTSGSAPGLRLTNGANAYIADYDQCSTSTWKCPPAVLGGISDGTTAIAAKPLPATLVDPSYPLPAWVTNATAVPTKANFACPNGRTGCGGTANATSSSVSCTAGSSVLGPGTYDTITVASGCLTLEPNPAGGLASGQVPGIFRIRTLFDIKNGAYVIGDGVTLVFDSGAKLNVGTSGGLALNTNNRKSGGNWSKAALTSNGDASWPTCATSTTGVCVDDTQYRGSSTEGLGITFYLRPAADGSIDSTRFSMSGSTGSGFGLQFRGTLYGPKDNLQLGGNSAQASAGQVIGWTITYNGSTILRHIYDGPAVPGRPLLLEPTLGQ